MTVGDTSARATLTRFAEIIDGRDWDRLPDLLAPEFSATFVHTGESFDRDGFVALNRNYPIVVRFLVEDLVVEGERAVLRARVTDGADTWHVASFATIGSDGLIAELVEVWAETTSPDPARRPG
jgi:SnoaL-like domain